MHRGFFNKKYSRDPVIWPVPVSRQNYCRFIRRRFPTNAFFDFHFSVTCRVGLERPHRCAEAELVWARNASASAHLYGHLSDNSLVYETHHSWRGRCWKYQADICNFDPPLGSLTRMHTGESTMRGHAIVSVYFECEIFVFTDRFQPRHQAVCQLNSRIDFWLESILADHCAKVFELLHCHRLLATYCKSILIIKYFTWI